ncbi:hypothetical protein [Zymomonas sp.]|uniref:hypothetical protein n=1 Tax=Zymomonas sp. TaxID=2068624 RepID=UPI0025FA7629|nr:hypothetical protein [Zymomonas sp.]MCA1955912.1 hypothetical protein [Zymomonas sp.]
MHRSSTQNGYPCWRFVENFWAQLEAWRVIATRYEKRQRRSSRSSIRRRMD